MRRTIPTAPSSGIGDSRSPGWRADSPYPFEASSSPSSLLRRGTTMRARFRPVFKSKVAPRWIYAKRLWVCLADAPRGALHEPHRLLNCITSKMFSGHHASVRPVARRLRDSTCPVQPLSQDSHVFAFLDVRGDSPKPCRDRLRARPREFNQENGPARVDCRHHLPFRTNPLDEWVVFRRHRHSPHTFARSTQTPNHCRTPSIILSVSVVGTPNSTRSPRSEARRHACMSR